VEHETVKDHEGVLDRRLHWDIGTCASLYTAAATCLAAHARTTVYAIDSPGKYIASSSRLTTGSLRSTRSPPRWTTAMPPSLG